MAGRLTEAESRKSRIDPLLEKAGWSLERSNLSTEFLLSDLATPTKVRHNSVSREGNEFIDYVLHGRDNKPLAIVEVKRDDRDPLSGKRQAADYADRIRLTYGTDPFIFLTAGEVIWFWDRERYPPRQVAGFLTLEDLERLHFQRQYRGDLESFRPDFSIADRPYQIEAIKRVTEALENGQRKNLLVMATGTGKTRTVISVIDLLMRAKWVQRVLYLADRRELVRQALGEIKELLPNETRARVEGGEIDSSARVHVATYPSMMQAYERLSPGYYDLIIADESHRSIYNRYKVLFSHFDALQLGLTATPTDYIDHNTFELFECPDGLPTFYYPYETAVDEGYLVNYRVLEAQTSFQLQGIKAGQLPPEAQKQLEEQGIELSEIDFEGSELERRVTNTGTNDSMIREFMEACRKDASGILPAKTIVFAMSHNHATELWQSFNRLYPDLQRRGLAEIIDSHMERVEMTLADFKRKDMPRVAISVDMLDTGIDVPAIRNLVFAKPVFSQVKFWQMIGRGTRQWRDPETGWRKEDFLIIDHWNNFAYFNINPEGEVAKPTEPLPVRLFRLRLEKLVLLRGRGNWAAAAATGSQLRDMLSKLSADSVNVRPHHAELDALASAQTWEDLTIDGTVTEHLSRAIAPLLRFLPDVDLPRMTFEVLTERLALAYLVGQIDQVLALRERIAQDLELLPTSIEAVREQGEKLAWAQSDGFWNHLSYERIQDLQATFAPLMRYRGHLRRDVVRLNLPDEITSRRWIIYGPGGEGAFADSYREQVELRVKELAQDHPTLQKLRRDEQIGEEDLEVLANDLNRPDLYVTEDALRQAYEHPDAGLLSFLRHILGLSRLPSWEEQITGAFDDFIANHPHYSARQINFVRAIRSAILRKAELTSRDLERLPFSRIGVARGLFSDQELDEILGFANGLAV